MSKLNVDQIEANSTNNNVKVVTKGTDGSCEIKAATNDATLQLNCSSQSHGVKLKAPANTASQNYTMILPDNQIAANKLLKVKSVTGNVGQLEYADEPSQSLANLNASNLTSGTLPAARLPTFPASQGMGLQLVSKQSVGSTDVSTISFTGLNSDGMYRIVGKNIQLSTSSQLRMNWLASNNSAQNYISFSRIYYQSSSSSYDNAKDSYNDYTNLPLTFNDGDTHAFVADFATKSGYTWMIYTGWQPGGGSSSFRANKYQFYATFHPTWQSIRGIKFLLAGTNNFTENTEILLYKYVES